MRNKKKVDRLTVIVEKLNNNKDIKKNLKREEISRLKYSQIMKEFDLKKIPQSYSMKRRGNIMHLVDFDDPHRDIKKIKKKMLEIMT